MNRNNYDVVVIGAGFAGLQAAVKLQSNGKNVLLLEATDRVGGRARSTDTSVDLGCTFVGDKHTRVIELAKSLGLSLIDYAGNAPKDPAFRCVSVSSCRWYIVRTCIIPS